MRGRVTSRGRLAGYKRSMKVMATILILMSAIVPAAANTCVAPTVSSARVVDVSHDGNLNHYRIEMTILNNTSATQARNTMQFVDIYKNHQKLDAIGIPPLHPGGSYKAYYTLSRSSEAGEGSVTLNLLTRVVQPACAATAPARTITF